MKQEEKTRVALVTGANRGIGFETCRLLAQLGLQVVLTSRDKVKGEKAVQCLQDDGLAVLYHPLDVTEKQSITRISTYIRRQFGRLDVLVNNAAIYADVGMSILDVPMETFRQTMDINFYGALHLCRLFVPLMRQNGYGRVVNVSSGMGAFAEMGGRTGAYRISKAALNVLTVILANEVRGANIRVNAVCPGWVRSDMGGPYAPRSLAKGAETIVWLATLPDDGPTGGFFRDQKPIPW
jgi:NAD(P)-dependent dehydrogenase (short-subunit alcohol dehydrogenase family)